MSKRHVTYRKGDIVSVVDPEQEEGYEYLEVEEDLDGGLYCRSSLTGDYKLVFKKDVFERFDRIPVRPAEVRRFLRHEVRITDLTQGEYPYERLICDPPVNFRARDVLAALRSIRSLNEKDATDALLDYLEPLTRLEFLIYQFESGEPEEGEFQGLTIGEDLDGLIDEIWNYPDDEDEDTDNRIYACLDDWIRRIEVELERHRLPPEERSYDLSSMERFIDRFEESESELDLASDRELALYRRFVDELCDAGNETAMRAKAYALYGGNRAYPCDWTGSRNLLQKLFLQTGDPYVSNTLGYICYYGRCNGNVPEYDKAFYYYSVGAAGGVIESRYKLADMFQNGYGVPQNLRTARSLLSDLYEEARFDILDGVADSKLADVALRLGRIYEQGIEEESPDPFTAYLFYAEADFAIRARMRICDCYGDATVEKRIRESLNRVRGLLNASFPDRRPIGGWIIPILNRNGPARITVRQEDYGISIRFVPDPNSSVHRHKFFAIFPEADFCGFLPSLTLRADMVSELVEDVTVDNADWVTNVLTLNCGDRTVLGLSGNLTIDPPKPKNKQRIRVAVVSAAGAKERILAFCPSEEIREGDTVRIRAQGSDLRGIVYRFVWVSRTELPKEDSSYPTVLPLRDETRSK